MRARWVAGAALILLLAMSASLAVVREGGTLRPDEPPLGPPVLDPGEEVAYVCPIHPDYTSSRPGRCPRDGMALAEANPYDPRDYDLELETDPPAVRAGEATTLRFRVFHPGTGEPIRDFLTVHDRRYHLFVISQDMEHFQHLHPDQDPDGSWWAEVTLPEEGYYKLLSDFTPHGGSTQFLARPVVTAGYAGDLAADRARLVVDGERTRTDRRLRAAVTQSPETFVTGLYGHLQFHLTEGDSGRPVTDLQPYLGSFGHLMIMSEDLRDYVHSHPIDLLNSDDETGPLALMLPMNGDRSELTGGPEITFEGLMPRSGLYRAWAQFRWNDEVYTLAHTFEVEDPR